MALCLFLLALRVIKHLCCYAIKEQNINLINQ